MRLPRQLSTLGAMSETRRQQWKPSGEPPSTWQRVARRFLERPRRPRHATSFTVLAPASFEATPVEQILRHLERSLADVHAASANVLGARDRDAMRAWSHEVAALLASPSGREEIATRCRRLVIEPGSRVMERKPLLGIERRAERSA
jgi:hypothetical protein